MNRSLSSNVVDSAINDVSSLEYILIGDLRDVLDEPMDDVTLKWLTAILDALLETLPREFALQDEGGYLNEVIECDPNLDVQVSRLAEERKAVFGKLRVLRQQLNSPGDFSQVAGALESDLKEWMTSLTAFHRHERRLVQTAFNIDVGTGD